MSDINISATLKQNLYGKWSIPCTQAPKAGTLLYMVDRRMLFVSGSLFVHFWTDFGWNASNLSCPFFFSFSSSSQMEDDKDYQNGKVNCTPAWATCWWVPRVMWNVPMALVQSIWPKAVCICSSSRESTLAFGCNSVLVGVSNPRSKYFLKVICH